MKRIRPRTRQSRRSTDSRTYEVGYGRPPRAHRFKPGRSGNPKGRPKGAKNEDTILTNLLNRRIDIREAGRLRKITVLEAMLLKFAEEALKGDPKAATFLLNRYRPPDSEEGSGNEISQEDQEILDAFTKRVQDQFKGKKS
jgi:Family of unknown function (DUF5681)